MNTPVTIMVAEDNPADVLLVKETLRQLGVSFNLEHYSHGSAAAKAIAEMDHSPDLILLDINLPGIGGLELLSLIRQREAIANATVAMFTSSGAASDREEAARLGVEEYIVKPMGYLEFVSGVGKAIQRLLARKEGKANTVSRSGAGFDAGFNDCNHGRRRRPVQRGPKTNSVGERFVPSLDAHANSAANKKNQMSFLLPAMLFLLDQWGNESRILIKSAVLVGENAGSFRAH